MCPQVYRLWAFSESGALRKEWDRWAHIDFFVISTIKYINTADTHSATHTTLQWTISTNNSTGGVQCDLSPDSLSCVSCQSPLNSATKYNLPTDDVWNPVFEKTYPLGISSLYLTLVCLCVHISFSHLLFVFLCLSAPGGLRRGGGCPAGRGAQRPRCGSASQRVPEGHARSSAAQRALSSIPACQPYAHTL